MQYITVTENGKQINTADVIIEEDVIYAFYIDPSGQFKKIKARRIPNEN